ncbi:hypothetical protein CCL09_13220 [Pseudomonas congelans]|nr:hypothetical protein CCL09_13220 [Pseudomonas congelans]
MFPALFKITRQVRLILWQYGDIALFEMLHLMGNADLLSVSLTDFCFADNVEQFSRNRCWSWIKLISVGSARQGFKLLKCFKIGTIHRACFVLEDAKTAS